jgi:hypothetical protein
MSAEVRTAEQVAAYEFHWIFSGDHDACPACGAEWKTLSFKNGKRYHELKHSSDCDLIAWIKEAELEDIAYERWMAQCEEFEFYIGSVFTDAE